MYNVRIALLTTEHRYNKRKSHFLVIIIIIYMLLLLLDSSEINEYFEHIYRNWNDEKVSTGTPSI